MKKPSIWKKNKFEIASVLLIIFLSFLITRPFFKSGYFPTHDGEWAVVRLGAMHRALMAGHFPVRWAGNLNFSCGYPLFLFTYPLPYYLGEIFNLVGFGLVNSIKLLFFLSVIFSGLAMYWLGKEIFGKTGGLIAAIFYLFAPFRLVDLYVRGSLGESLAFVLYPLLFLSILKFSQNSRLWLSLGAVFYGSLLLTHNVSALVFTPFLIIFAWLFSKKRSLTIFVLGVGLAAFFLFPALLEKNLISLSRQPLADISKHFVSLRQLVLPSWGYGSPGSENAFSFQLGWLALTGLLIAIFLWWKKRNKQQLTDKVFVFCFISLMILVALMLPWSKFFWQKTPLFSQIDFPWRLLGPASFFLALSLGYLGKKVRYLGILLAILFVLFNLNYVKPESYFMRSDDYYLTNEATTTSADELMPIWVKEKPTSRPTSRVEIVDGEASIGQIFENAKQIRFEIEAKTESEIQINTIYFPGWQVKTDNKLVPVSYDNTQGLIRIKINPGQHKIVASFRETPLRLAADSISLASFLILGGLLIKSRKNEN